MIMMVSFIVCLLAFVVIGALSALYHDKTSDDYLLAGQNVKPWLVGLSAVATNNSGYMFVGLIGYTYAAGLQSIWIMVGFILGDFLASLFVHEKLRHASAKKNILSYSGALSYWHGKEHNLLKFVAGLITIAFLGTYAAAQLNAGSKALHVLFDWDYSVGAIIGAAIVLTYCLAGGLRASIWTDAAQSFVMFFAMGFMAILTVTDSGGLHDFWKNLVNVAPDYMDVFPSDLAFGVVPFLLGWLFAGVGVIGQPHIMVRFMAMDDAKNMPHVRAYYYGWYTTFTVLCIMTGFAARLLIPMNGDFDAELALPSLARDLLHPAAAGLVLAGLFAATMSTADSQILSCSAAITNDLHQSKKASYWVNKVATVAVTAIALAIALAGNDSVFALVLYAWSALACAFGPLLLVNCLGQKPNEILALLMMAAGIGGMLLWRYAGYSDAVYEVLPGMLAGLFTFVLGKSFGFTLKAPD